jgi:hypothetical protein
LLRLEDLLRRSKKGRGRPACAGHDTEASVQSAFTVSENCHCEARSAEAIPCLTNRGTLVRQEIASALGASQ